MAVCDAVDSLLGFGVEAWIALKERVAAACAEQSSRRFDVIGIAAEEPCVGHCVGPQQQPVVD